MQAEIHSFLPEPRITEVLLCGAGLGAGGWVKPGFWFGSCWSRRVVGMSSFGVGWSYSVVVI